MKIKHGRIIARPFVGTSKDNFTRTTNRHDYALKPFAKTTLNFLQEKGYDVVAIGKINDIFDGYGVTEATRTVSNHDGMLKTTAYLMLYMAIVEIYLDIVWQSKNLMLI